jgi:hypothetical protein
VAFRSGVFRAQDAVRAGVSPERLRRTDLVTPFRGLRAPADGPPMDFAETVRAAGLLLGRDQYFSHVTAAMMWGCPVPHWIRRDATVSLHVTTIGNGPIERRSGFIGHRVRTDRTEIVSFNSVRTSSPAAFWYECRSLLSVQDLVILGDHLVGQAGLTDVEWLEATIHTGDRGVRAARAALELIRPGSESPMESLVRIVIVEAGFPEPACNVDVLDESGTFIGRVDLAWVELRIAVEYDGDHHRTDPQTFARDRSRSNDFVVAEWLVIHVTAEDVSEPGSFLDRLRRAFLLRTR